MLQKNNSNSEEEATKPQIIAHPKTIYWIDMPDVLLPKDRIELLKHDVLIKSVISEKLNTLTREPNAGYILNLDKYIAKNRVGKVLSEMTLAQRLLGIIQTNLNPERTIVHTTFINPSLQQLFRNAGILLIEKNIDSKKNIVPIIGKFVEYLFRKDGRLKRDFLRLELPKDWNTPIKITNLRTSLPNIRGNVKDLSLNGLGIILENQENMGLFNLKDPVRLDFYIQERKFIITLAFISRIHSPTRELGVIFNIRNPNMISEEYSTAYTGMIYDFIKDLAL